MREVPKQLKKLIKKLMKKNPEKRLKTKDILTKKKWLNFTDVKVNKKAATITANDDNQLDQPEN